MKRDIAQITAPHVSCAPDSTKRLSEIGEIIREEILDSGFTQNEFADKLGVCRSTVSRWISGGNLELSTLFKVADILGIHISKIIDRTSDSRSLDSKFMSLEQEALLAGDPECLRLYLALHHAVDRARFQRRSANNPMELLFGRRHWLKDVNVQDFKAAMRKLHQVGLLTSPDAFASRPYAAHLPVWLANGPLSALIRDFVSEQYTEKLQCQLRTYRLTQVQLLQISQELGRLHSRAERWHRTNYGNVHGSDFVDAYVSACSGAFEMLNDQIELFGEKISFED